jgi:hypothetical protein
MSLDTILTNVSKLKWERMKFIQDWL